MFDARTHRLLEGGKLSLSTHAFKHTVRSWIKWVLQMTVLAMHDSQSLPSGSWKEQFMACLTVPVFAKMRQKEAIALRDKNKPDSLFRYRPLDKETAVEHIERQL